jgi:hypothetical protein
LLIVLCAALVGAVVVLLVARGGEPATTRAATPSPAPTSTPPALDGPQLRAGDLLYNVTDVRILERPADARDLVNLPKTERGVAYLGVYVRVYNLGGTDQPSAPGYLLEPSRAPSAAEMNMASESPAALQLGAPVPAGGALPAAPEGGLLVYRINGEVTANQPLDLVINTGSGELAKLTLPRVPKLAGGGH